MYRGFKVEADRGGILWNKPAFHQIGLDLNSKTKSHVFDTLKQFLISDNALNGTSIQDNWFPEVTGFDVFISHSHKNERLAISLAGWLSHQFGLRAFVDSCVWGNAADLLQLIDKEYCFNTENQTYFYESRNYSTSHVHMMLGTALSKMMDNCECLFFLDTPDSLNTKALIQNTESPWIYFELSSSQLLKGKTPSRLKKKERTKYLSKAQKMDEAVDLHIKYEADTRHLEALDIVEQLTWSIEHRSDKHALDELYDKKTLPGSTMHLD